MSRLSFDPVNALIGVAAITTMIVIGGRSSGASASVRDSAPIPSKGGKLAYFPVALENAEFHDWWEAPRSGGRQHQGTDIFAPVGTPVVAVDAGFVFFGTSDIGGNVARLVGVDGTTYIYSHLDSFAGDERTVKAGEVLGTVGKTGNARDTLPHLHFEIRPGAGKPINPYPALLEAAGRLPSSEPASSGISVIPGERVRVEWEIVPAIPESEEENFFRLLTGNNISDLGINRQSDRILARWDQDVVSARFLEPGMGMSLPFGGTTYELRLVSIQTIGKAS